MATNITTTYPALYPIPDWDFVQKCQESDGWDDGIELENIEEGDE